MENLASNKTLGIQSQHPIYHLDNSKSYSTTPHSKSLGGNSELADWLDQAGAYYKSVMSGETKKPDPQAWGEFLNEMSWAKSQAYGAGNTFGDPMSSDGMDAPAQSSTNDFGGELGPQGNWTYDLTKTDIPFTGDKSRNDIFGSDNTVNLEQPSAKTSFEMTQDQGVPVLKVVVTTAKGSAVYYYDNYASPDFKLGVNMADISKVSGLDTLPADLKAKITLAKFDPSKKSTIVAPQSNVSGTPVDGEKNAFYYEVESADQTIDFHPKAGENETHYAVGNSTISLPVSSKAAVTSGAFKVNGDTYDFKVVVKHKDGSTDTFYTKKPFTNHINAVQGYVTFDGVAPTDGAVPDTYKDVFSLNGSGSTSGTDSTSPDTPLNPDHSEDTVPSEVTGKKAVYSVGGDVEIHSNYKDAVDTHEITTTGAVLLHGKSINDSITVDRDATTNLYTITFTDKSTTPVKTETYTLSGPPSKIIIDGVAGKISGNAVDEVVLGNDFSVAGGGKVPEMVQQLIDQTGVDQDTLLKNMWKHFPQLRAYDKPSNGGNGDGKLDMNELNNAFTKNPDLAKNLFGTQPTQDILDFIKAIDPTFSSEVDATTTWEGNSIASHWNKANAELVSVLKIMYPGVSKIEATYPGRGGGDWIYTNDITFGDQHFNFTSESEGATNQAIFAWY